MEGNAMKKEKWYRIFAFYIRQNVIYIIYFGAAYGIFALIFMLYELPSEAYIYALVLCLLLAAVIISFRFYNYCKRHTTYMAISKNIRYLSYRKQTFLGFT